MFSSPLTPFYLIFFMLDIFDLLLAFAFSPYFLIGRFMLSPLRRLMRLDAYFRYYAFFR